MATKNAAHYTAKQMFCSVTYDTLHWCRRALSSRPQGTSQAFANIEGEYVVLGGEPRLGFTEASLGSFGFIAQFQQRLFGGGLLCFRLARPLHDFAFRFLLRPRNSSRST